MDAVSTPNLESFARCLTHLRDRTADQPRFQDVLAYKRRTKSRNADDGGLFFDDHVPVETITLSCKEAEGLTSDQYDIVSEKVTHRLTYRPGAFVI